MYYTARPASMRIVHARPTTRAIDRPCQFSFSVARHRQAKPQVHPLVGKDRLRALMRYSRSDDRLQPLLQIVKNVLRSFQPNGEADKFVGYAQSVTLVA